MATAQQQSQQQPDPTTLAALLVILTSGQGPREMANLATPLLLPFGIPAVATAGAIGLVWPHLDHTQADRSASAIGHTLRTQPAREAAYVWNAAKRIATTRDLHAERRYLGQHLAAERGRRDAARAVDSAAEIHGPILGWYSVRDSRSSAGCVRAHGTNFNVAVPPIVEGRPSLPGSVHPHCRCRPGAPFPAAVREPARVLVGA